MQKLIIVGASSGIGYEMACIYAARGARVAVTGRRQVLLQALQDRFPDRVITSCFDVRGSDNAIRIKELIDRLGGLDLLIYNAGYGEPSRELNLDEEMATTATNVSGFVEITGIAFNYFREKGGGQIALTSSVAALRGNAWAPAYSASKAYMSIYAEGLNLKAAMLGQKIRVTDIRPGFVNTKPTKAGFRFWVSPVKKAAIQMVSAIDRRKRVAYVTKRWWLVAQLMRMLPYAICRRLS
ncbi:MAG TPA: SDR family NAD(P)-dependent oxidoreductase [Flavisolibacter sp.]|nr:SDR family NAD(P)-dependent oxidoreductase [Flavisolibacter sp.]